MFKRQVKSTNLVVSTVLNIDGYDAGMKPVVFYCEDLAIASMNIGKKKPKEIAVHAMIVTIKVSEELRNIILQNYPEASDLALDKAFVVGKTFNKLSNKQRLALLDVEYRKSLGIAEDEGKNWRFVKGNTGTNRDIETSAILDSSEAYGSRTVQAAIKKAAKVSLKDEKKLGKMLYKINKKDEKIMSKSQKGDVVDDILKDIVNEGDEPFTRSDERCGATA